MAVALWCERYLRGYTKDAVVDDDRGLWRVTIWRGRRRIIWWHWYQQDADLMRFDALAGADRWPAPTSADNQPY